MHLHKLEQIELGLLEHLHLADKYVLKGENGLALLLDLLADRVRGGDTARKG